MLIPRSIRCTKAEHRWLTQQLQEARVRKKGIPVDGDSSEPVVSQTPTVAVQEPVGRVGISVEQFLASKGLPPIEQSQPDEIEPAAVDITEWQMDPVMRELDRGICYEIDGLGYPEEAERFAQRHPQLWQKAFSAKSNKKTALYNEIMFNEIWEVVKNGKF